MTGGNSAPPSSGPPEAKPSSSSFPSPPPAPPALILSVPDHGREIVAHACRRASRAGVKRGMTIAHARALLPIDEVVVEPWDPVRDAKSLEVLAHWAIRFSPYVYVDQPDGLFIDITGCARLFHGEERLCSLVLDAMKRFGLTARFAVGPTFGSAWAAARFAERNALRISENEAREVLAPMPVRALRIDAETDRALAEVGVDTIEQLLALPRSALPSRFDPDLLLRLDQAFGEALEMHEPVRPVSLPVMRRFFAGPTKQIEAIMRAARELTEHLAAELQQHESGVSRLMLELTRIDVEPVRDVITLSRPSRDVKHLWSLLRPRLERAHLGYGVEEVALKALSTGRLRHVQHGNWNLGEDSSAARMNREIGELIDTMIDRLGRERLTRVEPEDTHVPERAFRHRPVLDEQRSGGCSRLGGIGVSPTGYNIAKATGFISMNRPSRLLRDPQPVQVMATTSPDGPPSWVKWRGEGRVILTAIGPERLALPWWWKPPKPENAVDEESKEEEEEMNRWAFETRDYFRVQDERGRWLWLFRDIENNAWFIHGLWA